MDALLERIYAMSDDEMEKCARHVMLGGGTRGGPVLHHGKGVHVWDTGGNQYIDCTSQSWALYLGYANETINIVVCEHMRQMTHVHQGFDTPSRFYLARRLAELAGPGLNRVSFTVGGGPALEAAMKICIKSTEQSRDFICLWDSYHGTTLGTMGASWISTRAAGKLYGGSRFLALTKPFIRVPNPHCYRCPLGLERADCSLMCARMLRMTLERGIAGDAAGIIIEPIQASAGQIILPKDYLEEVRRICDEFNVPLVYDEIQTYCRIGEFFAGDYFGVHPDVIALGKGFGAGFPIAAIIISDKLEGFSPDAEELHTFANTSVGQIAAAKQIELMENGVLENCRTMGAYLKEHLLRLQKDYPEMGDIRQAGLHIGVEFVKDPESKEPLSDQTVDIRTEGFKNGIIFGLGGVRKNVLKIKPPLVITKAECDEIAGKFEQSMKAALRK
jgi:4-aminobutyrate aminotransferase-like enzyme